LNDTHNSSRDEHDKAFDELVNTNSELHAQINEYKTKLKEYVHINEHS